jgi:S1-C subfamily serine protease
VKSAIAYVQHKKGSGTAFLIRPGVLATNNHVIQGAAHIDDVRARFISMNDLAVTALPVKLLYRDRARDLALLAVDSDRKPLPLAEGREIRRGLPIAVVGHPRRPGLGGAQEVHAVSEGTVEGLAMGREHKNPWYHLKADAFPGNSGGPVVDRKTGEVVGVLTWVLSTELRAREALALRGRIPRQLEAMNTFCIPSLFVREALARVEATEDREKLSAEATARYAAEMVTLSIGRLRQTNRVAAEAQMRGLARRASQRDATAVQGYLKLHAETMKDLEPSIKQVQTTMHLPHSTRGLLTQLLQTYGAMKRLVERPSKTCLGFSQQYSAAAKTSKACLEALGKELEIADLLKGQLLD